MEVTLSSLRSRAKAGFQRSIAKSQIVPEDRNPSTSVSSRPIRTSPFFSIRSEELKEDHLHGNLYSTKARELRPELLLLRSILVGHRCQISLECRPQGQ